MAVSVFASKWLTAALVAVLAAWQIGPGAQRLLTCVGYFRRPRSTAVVPGDLVTIRDTVMCEDLHYHEPSGKLFTACEDTKDVRYAFFPPIAVFDDPDGGQKARGSIHIIDPDTLDSKRLRFDNFNGSFVTHGIDVISDPARPEGEAVYILAVNHIPSHELLRHARRTASAVDGARTLKFKGRKATSQIEIFYHELGSPLVRHIRSVYHPLLVTPNDILAVSPTSFYVTNDHYYTDGLLRRLEDAYYRATWSSVIHVQLADLSPPTAGNATAGVDAVTAVTGLHNNNGIGRGPQGQVLINSCSSGILNIGQLASTASDTGASESSLPSMDRNVEIVMKVRVDSVIDNPSFFHDPYALVPGSSFESYESDKSGYVLAGFTRAIDFARDSRIKGSHIPVMVWYLTPKKNATRGEEPWEKRLLFEDDGSRISSASTAVIVPIPPSGTDDGRRRARLFITGPLSRAMMAVKVDL